MARKNKKTIVNKYELGTDSSGVDFSKYISDPSLTEEDFTEKLKKDGFSGDMLQKAVDLFLKKDSDGLKALMGGAGVGAGNATGGLNGGLNGALGKAGGLQGVVGAVTSGMATYNKEKDNKDAVLAAEVQGGLDTAASIAGNIRGTSLITKGTDMVSGLIDKHGDDTDEANRGISRAIKRGGQGAAIGTALGGPIGGGIGAGVGLIGGAVEGVTEQKKVDERRRKEREEKSKKALSDLQMKEAQERAAALKKFYPDDLTKKENASMNGLQRLNKGGVVNSVTGEDEKTEKRKTRTKEEYTAELDNLLKSTSFKDSESFYNSGIGASVRDLIDNDNPEHYKILNDLLNKYKVANTQWDIYSPKNEPNSTIWAPIDNINKIKQQELNEGQGSTNANNLPIVNSARKAFRVNPETEVFEQLRVGKKTGEEHWEASNAVMGKHYVKDGDVENRELLDEYIEKNLGKTIRRDIRDTEEFIPKTRKKLKDELKGFNEGGEIKGKGGPKSDSIPALLEKTGFVVPAENANIAKAIRKKYIGDSLNKSASLENGNVPVKVSDGEHYFTADEHAYLKMKGVDLDKLAPNAKSGKNLKGGGEPGGDTEKRIKILEDKLKEKNLSKEEWIKYNKALNTLKIKNYESQIPKALKELETTEAYNKHGSKAHKYREDLRENVKKSYERAIDDLKKDNDSSIIKRYNENKTKSIKDSKSEYYRKPEKENIKSTEPSDSKKLKSEYYRKPDDTPTVKPKSKTGSGIKSAVKQETTVVQEKPQLKDIPLETEIIDEPETEKLRERYAVEQAYKEYKNAPLLEREKKFNIERNDIIASTQLALGLAGANALPREPQYSGTEGLKKLYQDAQGFTNSAGEFDPVSYGLTPEEWAKHTSDINSMIRGNYQSIRDMAGGNTGVALANMIAVNNNALRAKREVAAIDKSYKREEQKDNAMLRSQAEQRKLQGLGIQTQLAGAIADDEFRKYREEQNKFDRNSAAFSDLIGSGLQNLFTSDEMRKMKERDIERKNKYGE